MPRSKQSNPKRLCIRPSPPGDLPYPDPPPPSPTKSRRTLIPAVYKHHYFQMGHVNPVSRRLEWHIVVVTPEKTQDTVTKYN